MTRTGGDCADPGGRLPKSVYELQLKLHSALQARTPGAWPVRLEVSSLQGEVVAVPFTATEREALLGEAVSHLEEAARRVEVVRQGRMPLAGLATPGEQACRLCLDRPVCGAGRDWSETRTRDPESPLCSRSMRSMNAGSRDTLLFRIRLAIRANPHDAGLWYSTRHVAPWRIRRVITFGDLSRSPAEASAA